MWILDTALKARADQNRPIRVGIVGAGFMCQGLTNQIVNSTPGMRVVAISNRRRHARRPRRGARPPRRVQASDRATPIVSARTIASGSACAPDVPDRRRSLQARGQDRGRWIAR